MGRNRGSTGSGQVRISCAAEGAEPSGFRPRRVDTLDLFAYIPYPSRSAPVAGSLGEPATQHRKTARFRCLLYTGTRPAPSRCVCRRCKGICHLPLWQQRHCDRPDQTRGGASIEAGRSLFGPGSSRGNQNFRPFGKGRHALFGGPLGITRTRPERRRGALLNDTSGRQDQSWPSTRRRRGSGPGVDRPRPGVEADTGSPLGGPEGYGYILGRT